MTAAAQTSEPTNPPTGKDCLLAIARWAVALLLVHWLIVCARKLAFVLQLGPTDPDDTFLLRHFGTTDTAIILPRITRALRRATALEANLHARRPTEQGFSIESCRAIAAEMVAICRDLGILRGARTSVIASRTAPRMRKGKRSPSFASHPRLRGERPAASLAATCPLRVATGPPRIIHRGDAEAAVMRLATRVYPRSFSGRAPAFAY